MPTDEEEDAAARGGPGEPDSKVVILANEVLIDSAGMHASAIRIERDGKEISIRFVVATGTVEFRRVAADVGESLLRRLDVMAGIAFTRKTEGRIRLMVGLGKALVFELHRATGIAELRLVPDAAPDSPVPAAAPSVVRAFPGEAIGVVRSPVREATDAGWGAVESEIHLEDRYARGLDGLSAFSHALVVFWMHEGAFDAAHDLVRRPRGREDMPLAGIFAQRAKHRPNPVGVTAVRILGVSGSVLRVRGLDAIDGTPVIDLKPYVPAFDRVEGAHVPAWMDTLMRGYFSDDAPPKK